VPLRKAHDQLGDCAAPAMPSVQTRRERRNNEDAPPGPTRSVSRSHGTPIGRHGWSSGPPSASLRPPGHQTAPPRGRGVSLRRLDLEDLELE
jgi:hypothetical protein